MEDVQIRAIPPASNQYKVNLRIYEHMKDNQALEFGTWNEARSFCASFRRYLRDTDYTAIMRKLRGTDGRGWCVWKVRRSEVVAFNPKQPDPQGQTAIQEYSQLMQKLTEYV